MTSPRRGALLIGTVAALVFLAACASDAGPSSTTAGVATSSTAASATPVTTSVPRDRPVRRGTYAVGKRVVTYVDRNRPTQPNRTFAGASTRTLPVTIWYPAAGTPPPDATTRAVPVDNAPADTKHGPYPLVLFSHGVTALGSIYGNVTAQWASAGYVVAAPDYPLSNNKAPGGPTINDTKNQPADASFVIDQVLANDRSAFDGIVDPQRIGAAGHSLGAVTTYGLVYSACCRDDRIGAAIVFAGATVLIDTPDHYFRGVRTPLLAVHGDADPIVPYSLGLDAWRRAHAPKFLVTIAGGNHLQPYLGGDDARTLAFYEYTTAFLDRYLKDDATASRRFHTALRAPGSGATLRQQVR